MTGDETRTDRDGGDGRARDAVSLRVARWLLHRPPMMLPFAVAAAVVAALLAWLLFPA